MNAGSSGERHRQGMQRGPLRGGRHASMDEPRPADAEAVAAFRARGDRPAVEQLAQQASEALGWSGTANLGSYEIHRHPYSETLRLQIMAGSSERVVWVKLPRIRPDNADFVADRIHAEYRILEKLDAHFRDRRDLNVVRPVAVLDTPLALITEEAPGSTLQKTLVRGGRFPAVLWRTTRLLQLSRLCGEWLRRFHETTLSRNDEAKWDDTRAYCEHRLELLVGESASGVDSRLAERIRNRLVACIDEARRIPNTIAGRHNDFAGHNIIVSKDGGISVLDFSMFDHDSVAFDYFSFIHKLEMLPHDPVIPTALGDRLIAAFVQGYGETPPDVESLKDIVYCRLNLAKLLTLVSRTPGNPLLRRYSERLERVHLEWLQQFANTRGS